MKKFLRNIFIFFIPLILLYSLSFLGLNYTLKTNFEKFRFKTNVNKIVIGDSYVRMAINDSLISDIRNISEGSEGFIYSFYKIKTLIKGNPQIDTIFLGTSFHNFSDYYDDFIYNDYVMGRYFYTLPLKVQYELLIKANNPLRFLLRSYYSWTKILIKESGINTILGGYDELITNVLIDETTINRRIQNQYFRNKQLRNYSISNIIHFNLIVKYCRGKDISLIILNTPMHSNYKEKVPKKFIDKYYSLINSNHLVLIEFNGLVLKNEDFLPDGDHLSPSGADLATKYLNEYIKHKGIPIVVASQ